ncbi:MAG: TlpA family protein disulfide reductase [Bacteroidetes bacterium]|nr:TlpA family protein disulfide reductase [Bacteroidota bacterium]
MKKLQILLLITLALLASSCSKNKKEMSAGTWRGTILLDEKDNASLMPFLFTYGNDNNGKPEIVIMNADEKIKVNEISFRDDTLFAKLPVFKDEIRAYIKTKDTLSGVYYHEGSKSKYTMPFTAVFGAKERFENANTAPALDLTGRWEMTGDPGDSTEYKMIAEFTQKGSEVTGTILTTSGDYRYLDGAVSGDKVMLSSADGTHTLLVKADIKDGKLVNGFVIGGPKWRDRWIAVKNENAKLPASDSITKLKKNAGVIDFTFTDLNGKRVSLSDEKYKGKPVIVQIMGSWCPNCMDETRLFSELYDKYNPKGLMIIGLCFESSDFGESKARIERFVNQLNAKYDFLYAGEVGKSTKETLPFIEKLNGYPTSLFLDKSHKVVKIQTGFSGPGTGKHYTELKNDIISTIESVL